jgi:hypothetical protein
MAILIRRPPQIMTLALDRQKDLIKMQQFPLSLRTQ